MRNRRDRSCAAVGGGLELGKRGGPIAVHSAELAVDIGGLHFELCDRSSSRSVPICPVEACAREQLHLALIEPR
jgi:hypothetical protein